jgi:hypothetical protein
MIPAVEESIMKKPRSSFDFDGIELLEVPKIIIARSSN